ncbi:MAG: GTP 3',8-cyclase MoaA, partial [Gammaproteobacteria bacterium]|nr:GTP 3',8-cyclase MoaA [Gammaproteobacteria bacterium]
CDFRCTYCLPRSHRGFATPEEWLTPAEVARIGPVFSRLGVNHIRLTGGEPLVRPELNEIVTRLNVIPGIEDLSLSTNASRLGKFARELKSSGITRLNISLDSLHAPTFRQLTGGELHKVLDGINAASDAGFAPIKINMVVMRGVNDHEVHHMVAYCQRQGLTLRFIEAMPIGPGGQDAQDRYMPLSEVEDGLRDKFRLSPAAMKGSGPARYFQIDDSELLIGFITPQSQHFCDTCNRVRLSVTGELYLCLGQENKVELGAMLRDGVSDEQLQAAILDAIANKPKRHDFAGAPTAILRPMSALGG